jgi:hypothetical protein
VDGATCAFFSLKEGELLVSALKSYLGSRGVRPNLIARDSSRLILVQVSLPMITSLESFPDIHEPAGRGT